MTAGYRLARLFLLQNIYNFRIYLKDMDNNHNDEYKTADIAIIGGGPAGMMAAISAAIYFKSWSCLNTGNTINLKPPSIYIIEKNSRFGKKLLVTGNGRCNFSVDLDTDKLVEKFGNRGRFFVDAFNIFPVRSLLEFFRQRGILPSYEPSGKNDGINKIFPANGNAGSVLECLISEIKKSKISILTDCRVINVSKESSGNDKSSKKHTFNLEIKDLKKLQCFHLRIGILIISTGGITYKNTGSTGDGYNFSAILGHKIVKPRPFLMPVCTNDKNTGMLSGISLRNIEIGLMEGGKVLAKQAGDIMFTHKGITGPAIFEIGGTIYNCWVNNKEKICPVLKIDFIPHKNKNALTDLYMDFKNRNPKKEIISFIRHALPDIPLRLAKHILNCSGIDPDFKISNTRKDDANKLIDNLKGFHLNVTGLPSPDKALVTEGGIQIRDINPKKMESLIQDGLFFAGEIVEIAGPEGGYNLQKAFSTGWLAGLSACDDYINASLKNMGLLKNHTGKRF